MSGPFDRPRLLRPPGNGRVAVARIPLIGAAGALLALVLAPPLAAQGSPYTHSCAFGRPGIGAYQAPPWLVDRLHEGAFRWRVVALDPSGRNIEATGWRGGAIARDEEAGTGEIP